MPEKTNPDQLLFGADTLKKIQEHERETRYKPQFTVHHASYAGEGSGIEDEIPGDVDRNSLVYNTMAGPIMWLSEDTRSYGQGAIPSQPFFGLMVIDTDGAPGNRLRVAIYKPERQRSVTSITNATLERSLTPLLPYPAPIKEGLADAHQMKLYPFLHDLPEEIDFEKSSRLYIEQANRKNLKYPRLVPKGIPTDLSPSGEAGGKWVPAVALAGLGLAAAYAISRNRHNRTTSSR